MTVIVYSSKSGSSKKYAEELSNRTGLQCFNVKDYPSDHPIIFIGWLRKDQIVGLHKVDRKRLKAVCVVGLDSVDRFNNVEVRNRNNLNVPVYYLRGWIDRKRLNPIDKLILALVAAFMKLGGLNQYNQPVFDAMMEGGSFYDSAFLDPVEQFLRT